MLEGVLEYWKKKPPIYLDDLSNPFDLPLFGESFARCQDIYNIIVQDMQLNNDHDLCISIARYSMLKIDFKTIPL